MPPAKKIAIACRWVKGVTGTTTGILEHTRRFSALGWEVHIYGERLDAGRIAQAGGHAHFISSWPVGSYWKRRMFSWLFTREIKADRFDIIHGHGDTLRQDILSLHNCVHAAHEAIWAQPLPWASGVGRLHAQMLKAKQFKLLIANSNLMKQDLLERYGLFSDNISVIYPGYDANRFRIQDHNQHHQLVRDKLGIKKDQLLIGLITSGDFKKRGVIEFLRAVALLPHKIRENLHLLIMGQEKLLAPYQEAAGATSPAYCHFLPPDPNVEKFYHALDIYTHCAFYEEFGQSAQEAMACGIPVVTHKRVGAAELFPDQDLILCNNEPQQLANRLQEIIETNELRYKYIEAGLKACKDNTWEDNFRKTHACYQRIIESSTIIS